MDGGGGGGKISDPVLDCVGMELKTCTGGGSCTGSFFFFFFLITIAGDDCVLAPPITVSGPPAMEAVSLKVLVAYVVE